MRELLRSLSRISSALEATQGDLILGVRGRRTAEQIGKIWSSLERATNDIHVIAGASLLERYLQRRFASVLSHFAKTSLWHPVMVEDALLADAYSPLFSQAVFDLKGGETWCVHLGGVLALVDVIESVERIETRRRLESPHSQRLVSWCLTQIMLMSVELSGMARIIKSWDEWTSSDERIVKSLYLSKIGMHFVDDRFPRTMEDWLIAALKRRLIPGVLDVEMANSSQINRRLFG